MKDSLEILCEQFIVNRDILKSNFSTPQASVIIPYCSLAFCERKSSVDVEKLRETMKLIKENNSLIKGYRGYGFLLFASYISLSDDVSKKFGKVVLLYDFLIEKLRLSLSLPLCAAALCDVIPESKYLTVSIRAEEIFNEMKEHYPMITGNEDSVFALLLALSEMPSEVINREIEISHKILATKFTNQNGIQSLSHILSMTEGKAPDKCKRVFDLFDALKKEKCKFPNGPEISSLGLLSFLPSNIPTISEEVSEVDEYLSRQSGYGFLGHSKKERRLHSALLVSADYVGTLYDSSSPSLALAMITAQDSAMVCAASSVLQKVK